MISTLLGIGALAQATVVPPAPIICDPFLLFFPYGSARLTVETQQLIDNILAVKHQFRRPLKVIGHADASGSPAYNRKLSEQRAQAVKAALSAGGVQSSDMIIVARGDDYPLVETGGAQAQNRRVEVSDCG